MSEKGSKGWWLEFASTAEGAASLTSLGCLISTAIGWWLGGSVGVGHVGTITSLIGLVLSVYTLLLVREISDRDRRRFALFRFVPRLRGHIGRANSELRDKDWVALRQSLQTIAGSIPHIPVSRGEEPEIESLVKEIGEAVGYDNRALPKATERLLSKTARLLEDAEVRLQKFERISDG